MAKCYQRGNENRKSKKNRKHNDQKIPKGIMRIRKSKKNRQHNEQKISNG